MSDESDAAAAAEVDALWLRYWEVFDEGPPGAMLRGSPAWVAEVLREAIEARDTSVIMRHYPPGTLT